MTLYQEGAIFGLAPYLVKIEVSVMLLRCPPSAHRSIKLLRNVTQEEFEVLKILKRFLEAFCVLKEMSV